MADLVSSFDSPYDNLGATYPCSFMLCTLMSILPDTDKGEGREMHGRWSK